MADHGCQRTLKKSVLAVLPEESDAFRALAAVAHDLDSIKATAAYCFASSEGQPLVNITSEWVKAIANQRQPCFQAVKFGSPLAEAQSQLQWLLQVEGSPTSSTTAANAYTGQNAIDFLYEKAKKDVAAGSGLTLRDQKVFDTFAWLLTGEQTSSHKQWVGSVFAQAGAVISARASTKPEPVDVAVSKIAPTQKAEAAAASTMSLFKKKKLAV